MIDDSFERFRVVHREVGEDFAVDLYAFGMEKAHKAGVGETFRACGGVDTLYPEGTEVALFDLTVAVRIGETFFPSVFCYGPDVSSGAEIAAGELEDSLPLGSGGYVID